MKMVQRHVVGGCSNEKNNEEGILLYVFHTLTTPDLKLPEKRQKWVSFVNLTDKKWTPSKYSGVCSIQFVQEDFAKIFSIKNQDGQKWPKKDEISIVPYPRFHCPKVQKTWKTDHWMASFISVLS